MGTPLRFRTFLACDSGAITILLVVLFPVLVLIGGFATDISLLNGQKRYVQSQADLAAQSAVGHLPDAAAARAAARRVVVANNVFDDGSIFSDSDVIFGTIDAAGQFVEVGNQTTGAGATALKVRVRSPYRPLLLGPVLSDAEMSIGREAVAAKSGVIIYSVRNRLLAVHSRNGPLLNAVLGPLGLGLSVDAIDYEGLAQARVKVDDLLGLVSAGVSAEALTFAQILAADVPVPTLLNGLGILPSGAVSGGTFTQSDRVSLDEILAMSPGLLDLDIGNVLPDISLNAADLVTALAALNPSPAGRLAVNLGVNLSPLLSVTTGVGLIRPPVTVIARHGDRPYPLAEVAQVDVGLRATLLNLVGLRLRLALATAEARLVDLNCNARPGEVLASFSTRTGVTELDLQVRLFRDHAAMNSDTAYRDRQTTLLTAGREQVLTVRRDQVRQPVAFGNAVSVQGLTTSLDGLLRGLKQDVNADIAAANANRCNGLLGWLIGCVVGSVVDALVSVLSGLVSSIDQLLQNIVFSLLPLDQIVVSLLDALGIRVAHAELVVEDYFCAPVLMH